MNNEGKRHQCDRNLITINGKCRECGNFVPPEGFELVTKEDFGTVPPVNGWKYWGGGSWNDLWNRQGMTVREFLEECGFHVLARPVRTKEIKAPKGYELIAEEKYEEIIPKNIEGYKYWSGFVWAPLECGDGVLTLSRFADVIPGSKFARPVRIPNEIKVPEGYELVPEDEWLSTKASTDLMYWMDGSWHGFNKGVHGWKLSEVSKHDRISFFARPIDWMEKVRGKVEGAELSIQGGRVYFRLDFEEKDSRGADNVLFEVMDGLKECGVQFLEYQLEHDCLTGYLGKIPDVIKPPEGHQLLSEMFPGSECCAFSVELGWTDIKHVAIQIPSAQEKVFANPEVSFSKVSIPPLPKGDVLVPREEWESWFPPDQWFQWYNPYSKRWEGVPNPRNEGCLTDFVDALKKVFNWKDEDIFICRAAEPDIRYHYRPGDRQRVMKAIEKHRMDETASAVPGGYEIVPNADSHIVRLSEGWLFYHPTAAWCPLDSKGLTIGAFKAAYPAGKVGLIVRPKSAGYVENKAQEIRAGIGPDPKPPQPEPGYRIPYGNEIVGLKWVHLHDPRFGWNGAYYAPEGCTAQGAFEHCKGPACDAISVPVEGSAADIRAAMASLMDHSTDTCGMISQVEPINRPLLPEQLSDLWKESLKVKPACKDCRFCHITESGGEVSYKTFSCRRYAPSCGNAGYCWSQVSEDDWCGEFQAKG